jgi:hypothetical protein
MKPLTLAVFNEHAKVDWKPVGLDRREIGAPDAGAGVQIRDFACQSWLNRNDGKLLFYLLLPMILNRVSM